MPHQRQFCIGNLFSSLLSSLCLVSAASRSVPTFGDFRASLLFHYHLWPTPMEVRVFMHIPRTFFFFPTSLGFPHSCRTTSEFSHQRRWYSGRTRSHAWTGVFNLDVTIVTRDACASWNTGAAAFSHQCYRRPHTPLTLSTCGVFAEVSATILDD